MQINHLPSLAPSTSRFPWYFALTLITAVVLLSAAIWGYTTFWLIPQRDETRASISGLEQSITSLRSERKIILVNIIQTQALRPSLDVASLVRQFQEVARTAGVRLRGFHIDRDILSTTLIAQAGETRSDPALLVIKMMRDYASGSQYFGLEPLYALSGTPRERTTAIQFRITGKIY